MRTRMEVELGKETPGRCPREVRPRRAGRRRVPRPGAPARARRTTTPRCAEPRTPAALAGLARVGALAPAAATGAGRALSVPAARLDGAPPARRAPDRHARAGRPDAGRRGDAPLACRSREAFLADYRRGPRRSARLDRPSLGPPSRARRRLGWPDSVPELLRRRRSLAPLPRLPRGRLPLDLQGRAEPRRADPQHHAVEADPRGAAGLSRRSPGTRRARRSGTRCSPSTRPRGPRCPDDLVRQLPYVRRLFEALRTPGGRGARASRPTTCWPRWSSRR